MKRISIGVLLILVGWLSWFLFIKPYDYLVIMEAKTAPGIINQTLKTWSSSLEESEIIQGESLNDLSQILVFNDSTFTYDYQIESIHDSLSEVRIEISLENGGPRLRLANLFSQTDFERRTQNTLVDYFEKLKEHLNSFRVRIEGPAELDPVFCAYVSLESDQLQKARGMMENYSLLSNYLLVNKVELNGRPFIEIKDWNILDGTIKYDFCYPIVETDSLPEDDQIAFKSIPGKRALKATYNGNYISSDRAWYFLLNYAEKNNISVQAQPTEVFFNNPNMGGDAIKWVAEIYMPILPEE